MDRFRLIVTIDINKIRLKDSFIHVLSRPCHINFAYQKSAECNSLNINSTPVLFDVYEKLGNLIFNSIFVEQFSPALCQFRNKIKQ